MALNSDQISNLLFKKVATDKTTSSILTEFFSEQVNSRKAIFPQDVWTQVDLIPSSAPATTGGVVEVITDLQLTHYGGGNSFAFTDPTLKDIIPFNFDPAGSYFYTLKTFSGDPIPFGTNDWFLDPEAGVLTFFAGFGGDLAGKISPTQPPSISCYKYIGEKGNFGGTVSVGDSKESAYVATTSDIGGIYNSTGGTGGTGEFTGLAFTQIDAKILFIGARVLVKDQVDQRQNGIYVVTSIGPTVLERAEDHDGTPVGEVSAGNNVFVEQGFTNANRTYILQGSGTLTLNTDNLIWSLFAVSFLPPEDWQLLITGDLELLPDGNILPNPTSTPGNSIGNITERWLDIYLKGDIYLTSSVYTGDLGTSTLTDDRIWELPDKDGTIALISDIEATNELSEVLANGNDTNGNDIIITDGDALIFTDTTAGYIGELFLGTTASQLTDDRQWILPDASGTVALIEDITSNSIKKEIFAGETITIENGDMYTVWGDLDINAGSTLDNQLGGRLVIVNGNMNNNGTYIADGDLEFVDTNLEYILGFGNTTGANDIIIESGQKLIIQESGYDGNLIPTTLSSVQTWNLPDKSGTIALLSDVNASNELSELLDVNLGSPLSDYDILTYSGGSWINSSSNALAGNALTGNAGVIDLGGALTADAIIGDLVSDNSNSFIFRGKFINEQIEVTQGTAFPLWRAEWQDTGLGFTSAFQVGDGSPALIETFVGTKSTSFNQSSGLTFLQSIDSSNSTQSLLWLENDQVGLSVNDNGSTVGFQWIDTTGGANFIDEIFGHGIKYNANYHATYINRSLVDKEYVDSLVSSQGVVKYELTSESITNPTGGMYMVYGDLAIDAASTLTNNGKVVVINGNLDNQGTFDNNGSIDFVNFALSADLENAAGNGLTWNVVNSKIDLGGTLTNNVLLSGYEKEFKVTSNSTLDYISTVIIDDSVSGDILLTSQNDGGTQFRTAGLSLSASTSSGQTNYQSARIWFDHDEPSGHITYHEANQSYALSRGENIAGYGELRISPNGSASSDVVLTSYDLDTTDFVRLTLQANNNGTIFLDNRPNPDGIQYAADYSATYTNRTLVDKGYVDGLFSTNNLSTVLSVGNTTSGNDILLTPGDELRSPDTSARIYWDLNGLDYKIVLNSSAEVQVPAGPLELGVRGVTSNTILWNTSFNINQMELHPPDSGYSSTRTVKWPDASGTVALESYVDAAVAGTVQIQSPDDKFLVALNVSTDNTKATNSTITNKPMGYVEVKYNGIEYEVGNGVKTKPFYFSNDGGATALTFMPTLTSPDTNVPAGAELYFNPSIAGFNLVAGARISLNYMISI